MAYTTIKKPSDYFNTVLYTGDATSDRTITNNFATEFLWLKERNGTDNHQLWDKVRGDGKRLQSNLTNAESDTGTYIALTSNGFKVDGGTYNNNGSQYAAWQWLANGTGASNTDGSITSTVSANTTSGFSIVKWLNTASNPKSIGHGLGVAPKVLIVKNLNGDAWEVYHESLGNTQRLGLNQTNASSSTSNWNNTSPTSSVFTWNSGDPQNYITYCFADVQGFSKFGSYVGNGSSDGSFIYTGFKPAFLLVKSSSLIKNWYLIDNKRENYNPNHETSILFANSSNAEQTLSDRAFDFLSNGFKLRGSDNDVNGSGSTYIYMAFAEEPLVGDNPATAR